MVRRRSALVFVVAATLTVAPALAGAAAPCSRRVRDAHIGNTASSDLLPVCSPIKLNLERAAVARPLVEGPVTGGRGRPTVSGTAFDLSQFGYVTEEFFLTGTAQAYSNANEFTSDGRWRISRASTAPYKTRIVVYRPSDPARFNGTVAVEWLNVSGGLDAAPDWITLHTEMLRSGVAWVGVSAQFVGIEAGASPLTSLVGGLKVIDPDRYSTLSHPGDSYSYDIYSQAGGAVLDPDGPDPLGGLHIRKLIAVGESQSAFRMVTYVNAIDPVARVFDGFLIHSRGGGGAPLSQDPLPAIPVSAVARIRTDVRVPVLTFQTETDLIGLKSLPDRQPDSRNFRLWETAGTAHADTYTLDVGFTDTGNDPSVAAILVSASPIPGIIDCGSPINSGPQHWIGNAAFHALERWVGGGPAPARAARLEVTGDPAQYVLDEHGNVRGGIRSPYVDAPTATLSGLGQTGSSFCGIFGTTVPFDDATISALYPTSAAYVSAVTASAERAVRQGFLLRADADLIEAWAAESGIGG